MGQTRGRVALKRETYDKLIEAYRVRPGVIQSAAALAACSWQLAKRVYSGPPFKHYPWAIPAVMLFEEERAIAHARAREEEHERIRAEERRRVAQFEQAREAQIETLKQENLLLKGARSDVLQTVALVAELGPAMRHLVKIINDACAPGPAGQAPSIDVTKAMSLLGRHALIMQRAVGAASSILDQGKVNRGEPTSILGIKPVSGPTSYDDALAELGEVEELMARAREMGAPLRLVESTGQEVPLGAGAPAGAAKPTGRPFQAGVKQAPHPGAPAAGTRG